MRILLKTGVGGLIVLRMLFGAMWSFSGVSQWMLNDDPVGHMSAPVERSVNEQRAVGPYLTFLDRVVLPNRVLFTGLVTIGEFGTGAALLLGFPARIGALGGFFMASNYEAAFGGPSWPFGGNGMIALMHLPLLLAAPYRRLSVGKYLKRGKTEE